MVKEMPLTVVIQQHLVTHDVSPVTVELAGSGVAGEVVIGIVLRAVQQHIRLYALQVGPGNTGILRQQTVHRRSGITPYRRRAVCQSGIHPPVPARQLLQRLILRRITYQLPLRAIFEHAGQVDLRRVRIVTAEKAVDRTVRRPAIRKLDPGPAIFVHLCQLPGGQRDGPLRRQLHPWPGLIRLLYRSHPIRLPPGVIRLTDGLRRRSGRVLPGGTGKGAPCRCRHHQHQYHSSVHGGAWALRNAADALPDPPGPIGHGGSRYQQISRPAAGHPHQGPAICGPLLLAQAADGGIVTCQLRVPPGQDRRPPYQGIVPVYCQAHAPQQRPHMIPVAQMGQLVGHAVLPGHIVPGGLRRQVHGRAHQAEQARGVHRLRHIDRHPALPGQLPAAAPQTDIKPQIGPR